MVFRTPLFVIGRRHANHQRHNSRLQHVWEQNR